MPIRPPRICTCGRVVPSGTRCACEQRRRALTDRRRPTARERGYTSAWEKARAGFLKSHPTCTRCGDPATVVDHITPHRGNKALFWDKANWQPLCTPCHSRHKQREEHGHE